jgi:integrase
MNPKFVEPKGENIYPSEILKLNKDSSVYKFLIDRQKTIRKKSIITQKITMRYWGVILKCFNDDLNILNIDNIDLSIRNIIDKVKHIVKDKYYVIYLHHLFVNINDEWKNIKVKQLLEYFDIDNKIDDKDGDKDFLTAKQQEDIWKACENPLEKLMISLLFTTGIRVGGLRNIKKKDVYDYETNKIKDEGCTLEKGNKIRRFMISYLVHKPLLEYLEAMHMIKSEYLFYNERDINKPKSTVFFQFLFKKVANRAGYNGSEIHIHSCRHSVARNLLESGNSMESIGKFLDHANPATTSKFYANLSTKENNNKMNLTCIGGLDGSKNKNTNVPNFNEIKVEKKSRSIFKKLANVKIEGKSVNDLCKEEKRKKLLEQLRKLDES